MPRDIDYLSLWDGQAKGVSLETLRQLARSRWGEEGVAGFAEAIDSLLSAGLVRGSGGVFYLTGAGLRRRKELATNVPQAGRHEAASAAKEASPAAQERPRGAASGAGPAEQTQEAEPVGTPVVTAKVRSSQPTARPPAAPTSELATLRRLLAYYADCVRYDERPSVVLYQDGYNRKFIPLVLFERWWPEDVGETCEITVPLRPEQSDFTCALARAEEDTLFLGYPLFVYPRGEEGGLLVPIFCIPASAEQNGMRLRVTLDFREADVNADWVQRRFSTPRERQEFLRSAGLVDLESESAEDRPRDLFCLPEVVAAVQAYCGKDLVCQELAPWRINPLTDLGRAKRGIHNAAVLFLSGRLKYGASLVRELRQILASASDSDLKKTALWRVLGPGERDTPAAGPLGDRPPTSPPQAAAPRASERATTSFEEPALGNRGEIFPPDPIPFLPYNYEQAEAIRRALQADVAVVTGPPGTGKSQVAANLLANLAVAGRSAVFASRNHKALDAVVPRVNALLRDRTVIFRTRDPDSGELFSWKNAVDQILAAPADLHAEGDRASLAGQIADLLCRRRQALEEGEAWTALERDLGRAQWDWDHRTEKLSAETIERLRTNRDLPPHSSVECVKRLLQRYPQSRWPWIGGLKRLVWRWMYGLCAGRHVRQLLPACSAFGLAWPARMDGPEAIEQAGNTLKTLSTYRQLHELAQQIQQLRDKARSLRSLESIRQEVVRLEERLREKGPDLLAAELRRRFGRLRAEERRALIQMRNVLGQIQDCTAGQERAVRWQRFFEQQFSLLVRCFPLWAIPSLSARRGLPLAPAMVDTVILDEASQCDIASAVPLLFRAKRAIIIGDPNQLRPVHNMKKARNEYLLRRHGIPLPQFAHCDFLQSSLYDVAAAAPAAGQPILLRDHFRCHPAIASYCNRLVYKGQLRVLTDPTGLCVPRGYRPGIVWTEVLGQALPGDASGAICPEEIEAVGSELSRLLVQDGFEGTVGVVTPFREQAKRIRDWAERHLPAEPLRRAEFVAATADGFQGDQRDVILCSPVYQPGLPEGSAWYVTSTETRNLWNVAVSRARAVLHVLGNRKRCQESAALHLRLLAEAETPAVPPDQPVFESVWERRLYEACVAAGLKPLTQYPLAGYRLDLAFPQARLDVEVDGERYHRDTSGRRKAEDLWRDLTLKGAGWRPLRFWVYELKEDIAGCVQRIMEHLSAARQPPEENPDQPAP